MRYADYYDCDICNGNAVGMSLFVQGCPLHCDGCFNPETWSFDGGKEWTPEVEEKFIEEVGREYIKRVSFLGGSPLCDENVCTVMRIIQKIRDRYPHKEIWVYTGYAWESLVAPVILDDVNSARIHVLMDSDVLIDGNFDINKRDLSLAFRGSSNQRIINVQESLKQNKVVIWTHDD